MNIKKKIGKFTLIASFFFSLVPVQTSIALDIQHTIDVSGQSSLAHDVSVTIQPESRQLEHEIAMPTSFEHSFSASTYSNILLTALVIAGSIIFKEGLAKYIEDMENRKLLRKRRGREQMIIGGLVGVISALKLFDYI